MTCRILSPDSSSRKFHAAIILKKRYSPEILSLVNQAFAEAEKLKISGFNEKQAHLEVSKIQQWITAQ